MVGIFILHVIGAETCTESLGRIEACHSEEGIHCLPFPCGVIHPSVLPIGLEILSKNVLLRFPSCVISIIETGLEIRISARSVCLDYTIVKIFGHFPADRIRNTVDHEQLASAGLRTEIFPELTDKDIEKLRTRIADKRAARTISRFIVYIHSVIIVLVDGVTCPSLCKNGNLFFSRRFSCPELFRDIVKECGESDLCPLHFLHIFLICNLLRSE